MTDLEASKKCLALAADESKEWIDIVKTDIARAEKKIVAMKRLVELPGLEGMDHINWLTTPVRLGNQGIGPIIEIGVIGVLTYLPEQCTCKDAYPCRYCQIYKEKNDNE